MIVRLASTAACVLALTVVSPAAAQAASRTFVDGPGDVWAGATEVPDRDQGDILRTAFTHAQRQVIVRTAFADLRRQGRIMVFTRLRTDTGLVRDLALTATSNQWRGQAVLMTRRGAPVRCRISHTIDYAANVALVRLPRTCLDDPRTVQAKFGVATWNKAQRVFTDNPINHGSTDNLPPYSDPVRVG